MLGYPLSQNLTGCLLVTTPVPVYSLQTILIPQYLPHLPRIMREGLGKTNHGKYEPTQAEKSVR